MEHAPPWLVNSFVYLAASVLAVTLSRAIGLGAIIGYLVAGIVIGPWGLGLIANVQDILHFAEFGVVLMLFLVGLELQPRRLWSLRRPIFGWGSAQVLACALAIGAAALALGVAWRTAVVAGLGLALSSTAIALQVLAERNLMRTSSGQAGFSILLFQDVAAIPILALLPLLAARSGLHEPPPPALAGGAEDRGRHRRHRVRRAPAAAPGAALDRPQRLAEIFTAAALLLVVGIAG
jgi:glutathione-regulated potassium-efflux system ancillary protein KefC